MSNDILKGQWKQVKGRAQEKWGELTGDEVDRLDGSREALEGLLQERYGWEKERARLEVDRWMAEHRIEQ